MVSKVVLFLKYYRVTGQSKRAKIPKNKVVFSSTSYDAVSLAHQVVSKGNSIGFDLFRIDLESRSVSLLQGNS